jgi:hypothetical protein
MVSFLVTICPTLEARCGIDEDTSVKPWGKLTERDFQAYRPNAKEHGAAIATSLRLLQGPIEVSAVDAGGWEARVSSVCVGAVMHKRKSAIAHDGGYGLAHEQLHFDITELFARALTERLSELRARHATADGAERRLTELIADEYRSAVDALTARHDRYDAETKHGTRSLFQRRWTAAGSSSLVERGRFVEADSR